MLRVGSVPYLVARPLDSGLDAEPGIQLEHAVPAELVQRLRQGRLDVALVSSIELFRQPGYSYVDGLAVAGRGWVSSVQVFLRRPVGAVRSVALDPASRTAATLARVVWPTDERPRFHETGAGMDPRGEDCDAWLRIGDQALRETVEEPASPVFNPSAEWTRRTGLPFVFAVWIVRPGLDLTPWLEAFARARALGRGRTGELVALAARTWSLEEEYVRRYLEQECDFEPGPALGTALELFRDEAAPLGLCQADLAPAALALPRDLSGSQSP